MPKNRWFAAALLSILILSAAPAWAEIPQTPQKSSPPDPRPSQQPAQVPELDFDQARRLLQQGKYDEAISALHDLEAKHPAMRGLAHELGAAYYKSGNFVNAIFYLKKAREQDQGDTEVVQ